MIQEVTIENFQSHKFTHLEFDKGVNVLVGDTDSGKSALIRSLEFAIWNKLSGKSLVSHWGGELKVSLKVDDNIIIRKKDKKDTYTLNDTEFAAIGNKVPDEISSILNMDEINLQSQIDSFFLLNETSGYVASYLNQIANLGQIDSTTKAIKSELNETKRNIEHDATSLQEKEKELLAYSFLDELKVDLYEVEELQSSWSDLDRDCFKIKSSLNSFKKVKLRLSKIEPLLSLKSEIDETVILIQDSKNFEEELRILNLRIETLKSVESSIEQVNKLSGLNPLIDSVYKLKDEERILSTKLDTLTKLIDKLSTIEENIEKTTSYATEQHNLYHSEIKKLDKCFFCGSKIK